MKEFNKNDIEYEDLVYYLDCIISGIEEAFRKNNIINKKLNESLIVAKELKDKLYEYKYNFNKELNLKKTYEIMPESSFTRHLISEEEKKLKKEQDELESQIERTIEGLNGEPSTLAFTESRGGTTVAVSREEAGGDGIFLFYPLEAWEDMEYDANKNSEYVDRYAKANSTILEKMYSTCKRKSSDNVGKSIEEFKKEICKQKQEKVEQVIKENENNFGRPLDSKSTAEKDSNKLHFLREWCEISKEKFCLELEIPNVVYKNATNQELKMIKKYKRAVKKKKEALAKVEVQIEKLINPQNEILDMKMAIEYLKEDANIPIKMKKKLFKILEKEEKKEKIKKNKIEKRIESQKEKMKIEPYSKSKYELHSNIAKVQEAYETVSDKDCAERYSYEKDILSFWKYKITREVLPVKKQRKLSLQKGTEKNSREEFTDKIKFEPRNSDITKPKENIEIDEKDQEKANDDI